MKIKGLVKSVSALVASIMAAGVFAFVPGGFTVNAAGGTPINSTTDLTNLSGNYYLEEDISITSTISTSSLVTIDLMGHTITQTAEDGTRVFMVTGGTFTIKDTVGGGEVIGNNKAVITNSGRGGLVLVEGENAVFNLEGGALSAGNATQGGGVAVVTHGSFNMSGGTITNCSAKDGGAVYVSGGTFSISGGTIEGNAATESGGGIMAFGDASSLNLSGGTIINNSAVNRGGGIMAERAQVRISGGPVVTGNQCNNNNMDNLTFFSRNTSQSGKIYIVGNLGSETCIGISYVNDPDVNDPETSVEISSGTGTIGAYGVIYSDMPGIQFNVAADGQVTLAAAGGQATARIAGHSLSLSGNIAVNYYMTLSDEIIANPNDYVMTFTVGDEQRCSVSVAEAVKQGEYYIFPVEVVAKEMATPITARFASVGGAAIDINGSADGTDDTYTVRDYAASILAANSGYSDKTRTLVTAMLNYGAAAQARLNYNADDPANRINGTPVTQSRPSMELPEFTVPESVDASVVSFYGAGMILRTQPIVRLYFAIDPDASLTYKINGREVTPVAAGNGYCYIDVPDASGLAPRQFANNYRITVSDSSRTYLDFTYSARNYFRSVYYSDSADATWRDLVVAMEAYYQAAKAY